jgi:hypothetical protein
MTAYVSRLFAVLSSLAQMLPQRYKLSQKLKLLQENETLSIEMAYYKQRFIR